MWNDKIIKLQDAPYLWQHEFKEKLHMCTLGHVIRISFIFFYFKCLFYIAEVKIDKNWFY